jgi:3-hydroxyisobutyrate dehydrogenase
MPAPESNLRVGLVGLGHMGRPIAARLCAGGVRLRVFDLREEAVARVVGDCGAEPAVSLVDLGRASDVVITLLPDGAAVRRVVLGPGDDRLLDAMPAGTVLVDMGSSSPLITRALGASLAERGVAMLDAPVSGGVRGAEAGTLAMMVGGDAATIARCRPLLALVGARLFVTGALGSGHAMKALNNLVSAAGLIAAGEALLVGRRFGLDPALMLEVLNASTGRNYATEHKLAQFVLTRSWAAGFSLGLMVKDLATAVDLARDTGTPAALAAECHALWARAAAALGGDADHTEVVRWLETVAGTELA